MKHLVILSAAAALLACGVNSTQAALLANPGFESPFVDDGFGAGKWAPFSDGSAGNTSATSTTMPRNGAASGEFNLVNANGFAGVFQDVAAQAGDTIDWSIWAKDLSPAGPAGGVEMRIEFRDTVGNVEISRTGNLVPTLTSEYSLVTLPAVIPAGADLARVVFATQSFGGAVPAQVFVDDAQVLLNGIPEPTTALLALLGLAPLARRRR